MNSLKLLRCIPPEATEQKRLKQEMKFRGVGDVCRIGSCSIDFDMKQFFVLSEMLLNFFFLCQ
jgi:hypothetical protein